MKKKLLLTLFLLLALLLTSCEDLLKGIKGEINYPGWLEPGLYQHFTRF